MNLVEYHQSPAVRRSIEKILERPSPKPVKLSPKMWILPNGTLQPLNQWHWSWLKTNPDVAERFKIGPQVDKIKASDEQNGRIVALKAGFFRVNYEDRGGNVTIEGCSKFWTSKIKDAVFMLVCENGKQIYGMTVTLFDDNCKRVVRTGSASLFRYKEQEKLDHIPLVSESAHGKALRLVTALREACRASRGRS